MQLGVSAIKYNRGHVRDDGMIFWRYKKESPNGEYWVSKEIYESLYKGNHQSARKWQKNNPELHSIRCKEIRKIKDYDKDKYQKLKRTNPDLLRKRQIQNRDNSAVKSAKRRAKKKLLLHPNHNHKIEKVLHQQRLRLSKICGFEWHIDHIMPLASGGVHHHTNLQLLPASLNIRKGKNPNFVLPDCYKMHIDK